MMRLVDVDKLEPDIFMQDKGLAISESQIANASTANAIPIPKYATNGDMIKAMFPNLIYHEGMNKERIFDRDLIVGDVFNDWWNAPYKIESEE